MFQCWDFYLVLLYNFFSENFHFSFISSIFIIAHCSIFMLAALKSLLGWFQHMLHLDVSICQLSVLIHIEIFPVLGIISEFHLYSERFSIIRLSFLFKSSCLAGLLWTHAISLLLGGDEVQVPYSASLGVEGCLIPAGGWGSGLLIKTPLIPLWLVRKGHLTSLLLPLWWGWKSRLTAWPLGVGVGSHFLCVVSKWSVFLYCPFPGPMDRESRLFLGIFFFFVYTY